MTHIPPPAAPGEPLRPERVTRRALAHRLSPGRLWGRLRPRTRWRITTYGAVPVILASAVIAAIVGSWPGVIYGLAFSVVIIVGGFTQANLYRAGYYRGIVDHHELITVIGRLLTDDQEPSEAELAALTAPLADPQPWDHR